VATDQTRRIFADALTRLNSADASALLRYHFRVAIPTPDEFDSLTESTPLVAALRDRIAREGPITFRDFMEAALYDPRHGYYATQDASTSRAWDYVTSPEVHPIFGTLVAKQIIELWRALGSPARFDVVEPGAGRGLLARDILRRAAREPGFADAVRYHIVERFGRLQRLQEASLIEAEIEPARVTWHDALPRMGDGCVVSNELFDSFPVHRVANHNGRLRELYVDLHGGRFVDRLGPPSTDELRAYFDQLGLLPGDGCIAEVNLAAAAWMQEAAASVGRGYVLTFDYGYEAPELYAPWRRDGTLLCFYRQSASSDPYQRVGRQDITSSVDFTTLRRAGEEAGMRTAGYTDQADFLTRLGIAEGVATIARERPAEMEEYFARRDVVLALIDPARLGRIRVLLQAKDAPSGPFTGFVGE